MIYADDIDFLVYSRAARSAADVDDPALNEEHWSYMDRFADGMVARGPTLAADRATWTGSLHIVDLPSADAAHEFVEREPYTVRACLRTTSSAASRTCLAGRCGSSRGRQSTRASW